MQTRRSMKNHLIEGDPINSGVIARVANTLYCSTTVTMVKSESLGMHHSPFLILNQQRVAL